MLPEEQEEHKTYLLKSKHYLMKIIEESSSDMSVTEKVSNSCFKNLEQEMQWLWLLFQNENICIC